jgi:hypothetical protein
MPVFSFRAECRHDADAFIRAAEQVGIAANATIHPDTSGLPDVDVEATFDANLEQLRAVVRQVHESHVMLQTLRELPLADNTLERDYNLF